MATPKFLLNTVESLSNFKDNVKKWSDDRIAAGNNAVFGGNGNDPLFSPDQLTQVRANIQKFKASTDPRVRNPAKNVGDLGNGTSNAPQDVGNFFNLLPTMDVWKVQQQGTALRGLVGGRIPVIPMVFAVIPALSAEDMDIPEPLYLFVNPKSWSRSSNKVQTNHYVRSGINTERWGEELETISASGTIGAFYTLETGLTRFFRRQTPSYRNLMMLLQIFKNNGCVYDNSYQDAVPSPSKRVIDVGAVEIFYDKEIFRGTFDSFSVKEAADKPYSLEYNFTFMVESSIHISDISQLSTDINASNLNGSGIPGQVVLSPNQALPDPTTLERQQQSLKNSINDVAAKAQSFKDQNTANSLKPANPEAGFQSTTQSKSVLLGQNLDSQPVSLTVTTNSGQTTLNFPNNQAAADFQRQLSSLLQVEAHAQVFGTESEVQNITNAQIALFQKADENWKQFQAQQRRNAK